MLQSSRRAIETPLLFISFPRLEPFTDWLEFLRSQRLHECTYARSAHQRFFAHKLSDGFAQRRAADAEPPSKMHLVDALASAQLAINDQIADRVGDVFADIRAPRCILH